MLGTGGLSYWAMRAERLYREEREKVQRAQEASVEAGMLREAARTDLEGQLVAYAASPGQVAADAFKDERNSPYTKRLLEELADPSASIQVALSRAGQKVLSLTGFSQRPFVSSDMNGDIYVRHWPPSRARKALVVSVGTIGSFAFPNVPHDGDVWSAFLRTCGFDVTRLSEPTYQQLDNALRKVRFAHPETDQSENTVPNTFVLFVFSGAGSREGKDLFLWASDSLKPNVRFDASRALDVEGLSTRLRNAAAASVIILDTAFPDTS